ncbi:MAG: 50S ribosomal protein L15 [Candidatus Kaelpia aquatica]|nr:50S ribosomal protein L15 [Candidatus Kaelpia aquatica]
MQLNDLRAPRGAKKNRKRVGRGIGSTRGKTSTRGMSGQNSRKSPGLGAHFEGGQMPLIRRIPKRGFNNKRFARSFQIVNLSDLEKIGLSDIDPNVLKSSGLIRYSNKPVKVLGNGQLKKKLKISVHAFSATAIEKIEANGGEAKVIE